MNEEEHVSRTLVSPTERCPVNRLIDNRDINLRVQMLYMCWVQTYLFYINSDTSSFDIDSPLSKIASCVPDQYLQIVEECKYRMDFENKRNCSNNHCHVLYHTCLCGSTINFKSNEPEMLHKTKAANEWLKTRSARRTTDSRNV